MVGRRVLMAACFALASMGANAFEGDPERAKDSQMLSMCQGCHGIEGYRTAFPSVYRVPKLGGQHPEYILSALEGYRDGTRKHPAMEGIARALTDEQMADLAAYYAQEKD